MTTPTSQRRSRPRRGVLLVIVLGGLLAVLATCVVVAQTRGTGPDDAGSIEPTAPSRASLSSSASPTPEYSGPPATPWQQASWRKATKKNQIIGVTVPPKPASSTARKDPLRVSVALLAALDSTNPSAWKPGTNPLSAYMSPTLAKTYTPGEGGEEGEDPGDATAEKLPGGAEARYEFYCHVASHEKKTVVSQCGFHVKVTSSGKVVREEEGVDQRVTAKLAKDGWRVSRLEPVAGPGGD